MSKLGPPGPSSGNPRRLDVAVKTLPAPGEVAKQAKIHPLILFCKGAFYSFSYFAVEAEHKGSRQSRLTLLFIKHQRSISSSASRWPPPTKLLSCVTIR